MVKYRYARGRVTESLSFITKEMEEFEADYVQRSMEEYGKDTKLHTNYGVEL